jgi:hypothetical protein
VQGAFVVLTGGSSIRFIAGGHRLDPNDILSEIRFDTVNDGWLPIPDSDLSMWRYLFQQTIANDAPRQFYGQDLRQNHHTASLSTVTSAPHLTFYAGAPLISENNLTIGVLFVVDTREYSPISTSEGDILKNLAEKCMKSLDHARERSFRNSWICKKEQLSMFTESQSFRNQDNRLPAPARIEEKEPPSKDSTEGSQETLGGLDVSSSEGQESERLAKVENDRGKLVARHDSVPDFYNSTKETKNNSKGSTEVDEVVYRKVFRRAAQCLHAALDADGVLFADGLNGFHGDVQIAAESYSELEKELERPPRKNSVQPEVQEDFNSRTYTSPNFKRDIYVDHPAEILWNTDQSSKRKSSDDSQPDIRHSRIDEGFLLRMMDLHPTSAMWYFTDTSVMKVKDGTLSESQLQHEDEEKLRSTFPNIRQLIFMTLHDHTSGKRLSACFLWRNRAFPVFSGTADLGSLELFLHLVESEIGRQDTAAAAKQKDTFVSSVSHELSMSILDPNDRVITSQGLHSTASWVLCNFLRNQAWILCRSRSLISLRPAVRHSMKLSRVFWLTPKSTNSNAANKSPVRAVILVHNGHCPTKPRLGLPVPIKAYKACT